MIKVVFEIVVIVAFQSAFCLEIIKIFFYFLKFIFDISTIKRYKIINFFLKFKNNFLKEKQT